MYAGSGGVVPELMRSMISPNSSSWACETAASSARGPRRAKRARMSRFGSSSTALPPARTTQLSCRGRTQTAMKSQERTCGPGQRLCKGGSLSISCRRVKGSNLSLTKEFIMTTIREPQTTTTAVRLHLALELSWNQWKLAFTIGHAQPPRLRTIAARDLVGLLREIAKAKRRFGLPAGALVVSCYEAGRDGFWIHRWLGTQGIDNCVIDSASIEVNRRKRRAKSDRLDAAKLVTMLLRFYDGETKVWSVVKVPDAAAESRRQLHRELIAVQDERTEHVNRIKALLASQGIALASVTAAFPEELAALRCWDGSPLAGDL